MNDGGTIQHSRSCVSPIAITSGGRSGWPVTTRSRSTSAPMPPAAHSSALQPARPPAPRSLKPTSSPRARSSAKTAYDARMTTFLRNGSGTWTAPLFCSASSSSRVTDENDAPPKPLRSVALPTSTMSQPALPRGARLWMMSFSFTTPSATTLTSTLSSNDSSTNTSPPTLGTPIALPYAAMPSTTLCAT